MCKLYQRYSQYSDAALRGELSRLTQKRCEANSDTVDDAVDAIQDVLDARTKRTQLRHETHRGKFDDDYDS